MRVLGTAKVRPHPWRPGITGAPYHRSLTPGEFRAQAEIAPSDIARILLAMAARQEIISAWQGIGAAWTAIAENLREAWAVIVECFKVGGAE